MKAVVWKGERQLEYTDIPTPIPKENQVKVKVLTCGFCVTDYHIITNKLDICKPPHVLGHEICGEIVEVGNNVKKSVIGKRVVVETYVGCNECEYCSSGNKHLCDAGEIGYPPHQGGEAEYVCIPLSCAHFIPDSITNDEGGIMEAVVCPFGAIMSSNVRGKTVAVYGAGVAGLSFIQASKIFGAKKVICIVRSDEKKAQALHFGADEVIDTRVDDALARIKELTDGYGVDFFADATGIVKIIEEGISYVKKGGHIILYGLPDKDAKMQIPVFDLVLNQISICGYTGNSKAWEQVIKYTAKGKLNLKDMVSKKILLKDIDEAVKMLDNKPKDMIKIALHPWEK